MTKEEKAREISRSYPMPPSNITPSDAVAMIENGALQMAEWKDKQFDKEKAVIFDMACDSYCVDCPSYDCNDCGRADGVCEGYVNFHDEFKNQLNFL